jgi:hypothetical protein
MKTIKNALIECPTSCQPQKNLRFFLSLLGKWLFSPFPISRAGDIHRVVSGECPTDISKPESGIAGQTGADCPARAFDFTI